MDKLITKTYGKAFFELALESNKIEDYEKQAEYIIESLNDNKEFIKIISHPEISKKDKMDILKNIFEDNISNSFFGLFEILLNKKRDKYIITIMKEFLEKIYDYRGFVKAEVISSKILDETQINNIEDKLSKKLNKKVVVKINVDSSLIAGLKIKICGHIIDGTVKKQIDDIKNMLYNIKMA